MTDQFIGSIDVVYRAQWRERKDPSIHKGWVHEAVPVSIGRATAAEAPLAFRMRHADRWLEWRVVGGILMREMLDENDRSISPRKLARDFDLDGVNPMSTRTPFFLDHPEAVWRGALTRDDLEHARAKSFDSITGIHPSHPHAKFWKWLSTEREAALSRAQSAADDLAVVDGTLFRRAEEPSIRVSWTTHGPERRPSISIEGVVPELRDCNFRSAAWFRCTEGAAAEALADHMSQGRDGSIMDVRDPAQSILVDPHRPEIEITGAWEPRLQAHDVAVPACSELLHGSFGKPTEQATSMAGNALDLACRSPAIGESIISREEAWSLFLRTALDRNTSETHRRIAGMHEAAELCRARIAANLDEVLPTLVV